MNIGGSLSFQLVDIIRIIESDLPEEKKREEVIAYQRALTDRDSDISVAVAEKGKEGPNLKNGCYVFGDINEMSYEDLLSTKKYIDTYLSSVTCEAEMKMSAIIRGYDKDEHSVDYDFGLAKKIYDYSKDHGKNVRGHTLVWHKHEPQALDDFITDKMGQEYSSIDELKGKNPELLRSLTLDFLGDYMQAVGEQFPDCYCWDVINEIVPDMHTNKPTENERKTGLRNSKWSQYIGKDEEGFDWYISVLKLAREKLPEGTELFYNEYGEQNPEKRKAILQVVENVKKYEQMHNGENLLDGIGLQSHYDLNMTSEQLDDIYSDFSETLEGTGKKFYVTEADIVPGYGPNGYLKYDPTDKQQGEKRVQMWNKMFELADKYNMEVFTGWGINDSLSWFSKIGCTMVDQDGNIKDYAKQFLEENKFRISTQKLGEQTKSEILDVSLADEAQYSQEMHNQEIESKKDNHNFIPE